MSEDLIQYVSHAESGDASVSCSKRKSKLKKYIEKNEKQIRQLLVNLRSVNNMFNVTIYTQYGLLIPCNPDFCYQKVLGEVACNHESFVGRVNLAQFNFDHKFVKVQLELQGENPVPLDYIKNLYSSYSHREVLITQDILEKVIKNDYKSEVNSIPYLLEEDWEAMLMDGDELPCTVLRVDRIGEKPTLTYLYNQSFMKLLGVFPNILIDVVMQQQKLPQIILEKDIKIWNQRVSNFIKSHSGPVDREYNTLIMTYEGMKVGVKVKETYLQTYCPKLKKHVLIQKSQFLIQNPNVYQIIYDPQRISKNTVDYLYSNKLFDLNRSLNNKLLFDTNSEMQMKYRQLRPCGFKCMTQQ